MMSTFLLRRNGRLQDRRCNVPIALMVQFPSRLLDGSSVRDFHPVRLGGESQHFFDFIDGKYQYWQTRVRTLFCANEDTWIVVPVWLIGRSATDVLIFSRVDGMDSIDAGVRLTNR